MSNPVSGDNGEYSRRLESSDLRLAHARSAIGRLFVECYVPQTRVTRANRRKKQEFWRAGERLLKTAGAWLGCRDSNFVMSKPVSVRVPAPGGAAVPVAIPRPISRLLPPKQRFRTMRRRAKPGHEKAFVHLLLAQEPLPFCDLPHGENGKRCDEADQSSYRKNCEHDASLSAVSGPRCLSRRCDGTGFNRGRLQWSHYGEAQGVEL